MMKLSLMAEVFQTVDEETNRSPVSDAIGERWDLEGAEVYSGRGSETFAWPVQVEPKGKTTHFLRFSGRKERPFKYVEGEMHFVNHLLSQELPVLKPVRSKTGKLTERVMTSCGVFHANLFEAIGGVELDPPEMSAEQLEVWGALVARVHDASIGYEGVGRLDWRRQIAWARGLVPESHTSVHSELDAVEVRMSKLPESPETYGIIHYDIDNVRLDGNRVAGIIDFDDCHTNWFDADITSAVVQFFGKDISKYRPDLPGIQSFVKGYRSVRQLDDSVFERVRLFTRFGNLITYARTFRSVGEGPVREEPDWTTKLRDQCAGWMASDREDFETKPIADFD